MNIRSKDRVALYISLCVITSSKSKQPSYNVSLNDQKKHTPRKIILKNLKDKTEPKITHKSKASFHGSETKSAKSLIFYALWPNS